MRTDTPTESQFIRNTPHIRAKNAENTRRTPSRRTMALLLVLLALFGLHTAVNQNHSIVSSNMLPTTEFPSETVMHRADWIGDIIDLIDDILDILDGRDPDDGDNDDDDDGDDDDTPGTGNTSGGSGGQGDGEGEGEGGGGQN